MALAKHMADKAFIYVDESGRGRVPFTVAVACVENQR